MKRRGIEEEVKTLVSQFESVLNLLPLKSSAPITKQLEILQKRTKPKKSTKGSLLKNQNSGLLKPVEISEKMSEFAGWNIGELHSRVDVTKAICNYIKTNELQKQSNKKTILPDDVLKKILNWDEENQKMIINVVNVQINTDTNDESFLTFVIEKIPNNGLKKIGYYNGSELFNNLNFVATIKHLKMIKSENNIDCFCGTLDNIQEKIINENKLSLHVPLTYPKIQTCISSHLKGSEKIIKPIKIKKNIEKIEKKVKNDSEKSKKSQDKIKEKKETKKNSTKKSKIKIEENKEEENKEEENKEENKEEEIKQEEIKQEEIKQEIKEEEIKQEIKEEEIKQEIKEEEIKEEKEKTKKTKKTKEKIKNKEENYENCETDEEK
jgi:hypothetical protein